MATTYLEVVNKVMLRLREPQVTSINDTDYSKLIAALVNTVKREVEDAWEWSALRTTFTATTSSGLFNYVLTGSGVRTRVLDVINDTDNFNMQYASTSWMNQQFLNATPQNGSPIYYNFNGVNTSGDSQVDIFPIPDGVYSLRFNVVMPQGDLTLDANTLTVPYQIVVEGVIARAVEERGEDGGYAAQEGRYRQILSDYIAIDAGYRPDELIWNYT